MQHRGALEGLAHRLGVACKHLEIERPETFAEQVRSRPRALGGNSLREQDADKKGVGGRAEELVGVGIASERLADLRRTQRLEFAAI